MTAGERDRAFRGVPADHGPVLHGAQLWVALPDADRSVAPAFEHHADLPGPHRAGAAGHRAAR